MKLEIFIFFLYAIKDEPEARPKTTLFAGGEGMHKSTLKFNAFDVLMISNDFLRGNDVITVSRINWLLLTRNGFISVFDFFFNSLCKGENVGPSTTPFGPGGEGM